MHPQLIINTLNINDLPIKSLSYFGVRDNEIPMSPATLDEKLKYDHSLKAWLGTIARIQMQQEELKKMSQIIFYQKQLASLKESLLEAKVYRHALPTEKSEDKYQQINIRISELESEIDSLQIKVQDLEVDLTQVKQTLGQLKATLIQQPAKLQQQWVQLNRAQAFNVRDQFAAINCTIPGVNGESPQVMNIQLTNSEVQQLTVQSTPFTLAKIVGSRNPELMSQLFESQSPSTSTTVPSSLSEPGPTSNVPEFSHIPLPPPLPKLSTEAWTNVQKIQEIKFMHVCAKNEGIRQLASFEGQNLSTTKDRFSPSDLRVLQKIQNGNIYQGIQDILNQVIQEQRGFEDNMFEMHENLTQQIHEMLDQATQLTKKQEILENRLENCQKNLGNLHDRLENAVLQPTRSSNQDITSPMHLIHDPRAIK